MASYERNFVRVILIVFYSIMILEDNVNCPIIDRVVECRIHMIRYCGNDLTSDLTCAKEAITNIHRGLTPELRQTPDYIFQYFAINISPYVENIILPEPYCESEEYLSGQDITQFLVGTLGPTTVMTWIQRVKLACLILLEPLFGRPILDIFVKKDIHNFTGNAVIEKYLRELSQKITLKEIMKKYCGNNLHSDLNCAKSAIRKTHEGKSLGQRGTPGYVLQYFAAHVSPFIREHDGYRYDNNGTKNGITRTLDRLYLRDPAYSSDRKKNINILSYTCSVLK